MISPQLLQSIGAPSTIGDFEVEVVNLQMWREPGSSSKSLAPYQKGKKRDLDVASFNQMYPNNSKHTLDEWVSERDKGDGVGREGVAEGSI